MHVDETRSVVFFSHPTGTSNIGVLDSYLPGI